MPAAVALPWIIGAGAAASVGGAAIQAHAAGKASKAQMSAADKDLALQTQVYHDQMARTQPYVDFGTQSLANLGRLRDTPFSTQTQGLTNAARYGGPPPAYQMGQPQGGGMPLSALGQRPQGQPMAMGQMGGGQTVRMVGPDGTPNQVPQANVQEALRRGARLA